MPRARRPDYVSNLIAGLQAEGLSGRQALERLRETGYAIRTQTFYREWGALQHSEAVRGQLESADPFHTPTETEITEVPRPKARGLQYNVDILSRDTATGALMFTPTSIVTPELITHLEAIEQAAEELRAAMAGGVFDSGYQEIIGGGVVTSVLRRVPQYDEPAE